MRCQARGDSLGSRARGRAAGLIGTADQCPLGLVRFAKIVTSFDFGSFCQDPHNVGFGSFCQNGHAVGFGSFSQISFVLFVAHLLCSFVVFFRFVSFRYLLLRVESIVK
jgi:hypothetical protein